MSKEENIEPINTIQHQLTGHPRGNEYLSGTMIKFPPFEFLGVSHSMAE